MLQRVSRDELQAKIGHIEDWCVRSFCCATMRAISTKLTAHAIRALALGIEETREIERANELNVLDAEADR